LRGCDFKQARTIPVPASSLDDEQEVWITGAAESSYRFLVLRADRLKIVVLILVRMSDR
jgi:hypothetical protein